MSDALVGRDYNTYGYSCAGAIGFGSRGSWTSAFNNVSPVFWKPILHAALTCPLTRIHAVHDDMLLGMCACTTL